MASIYQTALANAAKKKNIIPQPELPPEPTPGQRLAQGAAAKVAGAATLPTTATQKETAQLNPYQATLAAATPGATTGGAVAPTSTQGGRMEDGTYRLSDGSTYDTLQGAVNANAGSEPVITGEGRDTMVNGVPLYKGTGVLAKDSEKTGKITVYPNGTSTITDAAGNIFRWESQPDQDYLHGYFKSSDGYIYNYDTATDDELWSHGYVRDGHGVRIANDNDYAVYNARVIGATPGTVQNAVNRLKKSGNPIGGAGNTQNTAPTPQGGNGTPSNPPEIPSANSRIEKGRGTGDGSSGYTPSGGGTPSGGTTPTGATGGTGYTPYQLTLDQFDYGTAPEWEGTEYEQKRDAALEAAQNMRWDGSEYQTERDRLLEEAMRPYEGSPYDQQRDDALARYGEEWQGSEYQAERDAALKRAQNMQWNYDPDRDPVWQALQKQYRREGDRASQEALAQAAMRTGGLANSYAVTAASQAGDYYAAQLSDRLPQLYQDAYQRYLSEFQRQLGISDQYQGFDDREYSRWADQQGKNLDLADRYNQYGQQDYDQYRDRVSQQLSGADRYNGYDQTEYQRYLDQYGQQLDAADRYNNYGATEYDRYRDRLGQWNTDRNFQYGLNRDAVEDARYADEKAYSRNRDTIADEKWWAQFNRQNFENDRAWEENLRRYADEQNWKAKDWDFMLQQYSNQLSQWEKNYILRQKELAMQEEDNALGWEYKNKVFEADQEQNNIDNTYKATAYQKELEAADDKRYKEGLSLWSQLGVLPERYADIVGYPAGTRWEDVFGNMDAEEAYSGDGGSGSSTYTGNSTVIPMDENGNLELSDEDSAAVSLGGKKGNAQTMVPGVVHSTNGKPMTTGFRDWWPTIRDAYDQGATASEIIQAVDNLIKQGVIADYEKDVILSKLRIYGNGGR